MNSLEKSASKKQLVKKLLERLRNYGRGISPGAKEGAGLGAGIGGGVGLLGARDEKDPKEILKQVLLGAAGMGAIGGFGTMAAKAGGKGISEALKKSVDELGNAGSFLGAKSGRGFRSGMFGFGKIKKAK